MQLGIMIEFSCSCGYKQELNLGGGMFSHQEGSFLRRYSESALQPYLQAKANGTLDYFSFDNHPAVCDCTPGLLAVPVLHVAVRGGEDFDLPAPCHHCGGVVELLQEPYACPRCRGELATRRTGLWD